MKIKSSIYLITFFPILLILNRILISQQLLYGFLIWNIFLAIVPFLIVKYVIKSQQSLSVFSILFLIWLLFLPNAPYIITDFLHLKPRVGIPMWFDILLLMSASITGLIFGLMALQQMFHHLGNRFSDSVASAIILISCLLSGFGIYLGRFQRYNSWDILLEPLNILKDVNYLFSPIGLSFTLGFGLFFYLLFNLSKYYSHDANLSKHHS